MHRDRDPGFTLVELLVVVVLLGLVLTVVSAAFVTILRVAPQNEFRIDDARATRGLQTWLVRDIASTPPRASVAGSTGFVLGSDSELANVNTCGASGTPVIHMTWIDGPKSYHANYRIDGGDVVRTLCGGDTATMSLASGVATSPCPSAPSAHAWTLDAYDSINLCLLAIEGDTGLNGGGGDTREIQLSVTSRSPT